MRPRWVRSLDDYWSWFAEQLASCGGQLEDGDSLIAEVVEDPDTKERLALILGRQRLFFPDGSWLEFSLVVNRDLEMVEYNFHYAASDGRLVWRLDRHPGHADMLAHIHLPPNRREPHEEVEIDDVLDKIFEYLRSSPPTPYRQPGRPRRRLPRRRRKQ
jgi:Family of unknown function (DUF6516)